MATIHTNLKRSRLWPADRAHVDLIDLTHPRFGSVLQTAGFAAPIALTQKAAASIIYNVFEQPMTSENINSRILKVLRSLHRTMPVSGLRSSTPFNVSGFNRWEKTIPLQCIRRSNAHGSSGFIIMRQEEDNHFN